MMPAMLYESLQMETICPFDVRSSDMHCRPCGDQRRWTSVKKSPEGQILQRERNKERRASVSSAAPRTVLRLTVRSR
ncbi:hypothetical protein VZT92_016528 [Zoarces viviparus]|uniref:Uncharacterized protein n=1 Tax=Zoarces viviparus TaxID=48416 RepID=A0AAW1ETE6_ZOAVI